MGQTLKLADARNIAPPVEVLSERAQALRQAVTESVTTDDVAEMMKAIVTKAKGGDLAAAKFVLDYLTGGAPKVQLNIGVRGKSQPEDQPPATTRPVVYPPSTNGNGHTNGRTNGTGHARHNPDLDEAMDSRKPTVGELRRRVARYLKKNGPTPEADLCELFEIEPVCADTIFQHEWFDKAKDGWHVTPAGRKDTGG